VKKWGIFTLSFLLLALSAPGMFFRKDEKPLLKKAFNLNLKDADGNMSDGLEEAFIRVGEPGRFTHDVKNVMREWVEINPKVAAKFGAFTILMLMLLLFSAPAWAHDWFTNSGCCDGNDCQPWVPTAQNFTPTAEGYHIRLSRAELLKITPDSDCPLIDEVVPYNSSKVKASPVSSFGLCVKYYNKDDGTCVRCLFVPGDI